MSPLLFATVCTGLAALAVACWLRLPCKVERMCDPRSSDGSRFWGRRNAEATTGKVVTKESGAPSSRERAAEALAEAEREAPPERTATDDVRELRLLLIRQDRLHREERDRARAEYVGLRAACAERGYLIASTGPHPGDLHLVGRGPPEMAEENDRLRGALTECRRELAEARAAQAVPVPSGQTVTTGGVHVVGGIVDMWRPLVSFDKDAAPLFWTTDSAGNTVWTPPPADGTCS